MKKEYVLLACLLPLYVASAFVCPAGKVTGTCPAPPAVRTAPSDGFAVVELFTSEGCSSCPPADQLLAEIDTEYKSQVYVLSFHVDYWDRLGWRDVFSNANYTHRQEEYAHLLSVREIYTPQAVVNGKWQMLGSSRDLIRGAIDQELKGTANSGLQLQAISKDSKKVSVHFTSNYSAPATLQAALVQLQASSNVLRGENKGKQLQHVNIVRYFESIYLDNGTTKGSIQLKIPSGLQAKDCKVIVFLQSPTDGHIIGVGEARVGEFPAGGGI